VRPPRVNARPGNLEPSLTSSIERDRHGPWGRRRNAPRRQNNAAIQHRRVLTVVPSRQASGPIRSSDRPIPQRGVPS